MKYFSKGNVVKLGFVSNKDEAKEICVASSQRLATKIGVAMNAAYSSTDARREYFMRGTGNPKKMLQTNPNA